jgi:tRNA pseudouridine55 synthase
MLPETTLQEVQDSFDDKIIIVDKPLDFTSADVVRLFKKQFRINKIGHAGSLDPKATGLLILCTDSMTKKIDMFMDLEKEYSGIIRIGAITKSFDTEKEEENEIDTSHITDEEIQKVINSFLGETEQMPPMYSALKHKGRALYKLAREGKVIERQVRKINISSIEARKINQKEVFFNVVCSKGTYIRVIADDFGAKLGVGGYLLELRRLRIGTLTLENLDREVKNIRYKFINNN